MSSAIPAEPRNTQLLHVQTSKRLIIPEPSNRAVPDSFLNSFFDEPTTAFSTAAGIFGDIAIK